MPSYEILSERDVTNNGGKVTLTLYYQRDGAQKACVFVYPESLQNPEDPRAWLEKLLERGENPTGPVTYNAEGSSWS